jgi:hypothetical protein
MIPLTTIGEIFLNSTLTCRSENKITQVVSPCLLFRSDADLQAYVKKYSLPLSADKPREGIIDTIRQSYHGVVDAWSDSDLKCMRSLHK